MISSLCTVINKKTPLFGEVILSDPCHVLTAGVISPDFQTVIGDSIPVNGKSISRTFAKKQVK
jgi:hypothetical protein